MSKREGTFAVNMVSPMKCFRSLVPVVGLVALAAGPRAFAALQDSDPFDTPTLSVSTRLVQVDVIVRADDGPVEGLSAADFVIYDDGERREIVTFDVLRTAAGDAGAIAAAPLPPGVITNIPRSAGPARQNASVLLIDRLNTRTLDQIKVQDQAAKFIASLDGSQSVAIYELGIGLRLVQDYTHDPAVLLAALQATDPRASGALDASFGQGAAGGLEASRGDAGLDLELVRAQGQGASPLDRGNVDLDQLVAQYFLNDRVRSTADALEVIARAMEGMSARKSLIWVAGRFPFSFDPSAHFTEAEASASTRRQLEKAGRAITDANIAVYPISAVGLLAPEFNQPRFSPYTTPGTRGPGVFLPGGEENAFRYRRQFSTDQARLETEPDSTHVMNHIAGVTGGEAFYSTNGIAEAMTAALDAAAVVYTLGFTPGDRLDADFHELRVEVMRDGVDVRHRAGYYGFASAAGDGTDSEPIANLVRSPINATGIELVAVDQPLFGEETRYVTRLVINPDDLDLEYRDSFWRGAIEVATFTVDSTVTQPEVDVGSIEIRLSDGDFARYRESGYEVFRFVNGSGRTGYLRVVVRSGSNQAAGSLWIPLN